LSSVHLVRRPGLHKTRAPSFSSKRVILANLGSVAKRVEIQNEFSTQLIDILKEGIGNLVDADLAEESAMLQALQIQQQLGVQSLSIANASPQSILGLF